MKRGKIQLGGASPIFRISAPGHDVDTAPANGFLLHEDHLYSQPFFWQYVSNPFAGYTGAGVQDATVPVTYPSVGVIPTCILYPVASTGSVSFPRPRSLGVGSNESTWVGLENWQVQFNITSLTNVNVRFTKTNSSPRSPQGAYLVLFRRAS